MQQIAHVKTITFWTPDYQCPKFSVLILHVEKLMLPSPEKSVVACFYSRVLFRVPDGEKPIRFIESASSLLPDFCMDKGLSATGNAASSMSCPIW